MNILIIYPRPDQFKKPRFGFSYELLTIATLLNQYHNVYIKDYSCEKYEPNWLINSLKNNMFDLVIIECDSFALKRSQNIIHATEILSFIRGIKPTIAYGNYCYITKKFFPHADYTIFYNDINLIINIINSFYNNKIHFINNFDEIPYINRNLLLSIPFYLANKKNTLIQTSKGCENTCIFCQRKGWQKNYIEHSDNYVFEEINMLLQNKYKNIWIIDDNFTFNLSRAKRLLKKIIQNCNLGETNFFISSWTNIDFEFIDIAASANIKVISFGIESGDTQILNFYRKNINLKNVPNLIRYANQAGIFTVGNFILGAPMETLDTINTTFNLIVKCEFDQINIKTLDYMIGSELYSSLDVEKQFDDHIFSCAENGLSKFSLNDLVTIKNNFKTVYYKKNKQRLKNKILQFGTPF